jgi:hypothetical protein
MWILLSRSPPPDAPYWPGRRLLAALDALMWPSLWLAAIFCGPLAMGIVGIVATVGLILSAASRLQRALLQNERYRFTAWRWGIWLSLAASIGAVAKLVAG